jgi:hypothetical protein
VLQFATLSGICNLQIPELQLALDSKGLDNFLSKLIAFLVGWVTLRLVCATLAA